MQVHGDYRPKAYDQRSGDGSDLDAEAYRVAAGTVLEIQCETAVAGLPGMDTAEAIAPGLDQPHACFRMPVGSKRPLAQNALATQPSRMWLRSGQEFTRV